MSGLRHPYLASVILHLEQGLDLLDDARDGYLTVISLELNAWLVALRLQIPAISDTVTLTSDADGLTHFAALLTVPDIGDLLYKNPMRIRVLLQSSISFLRSVAAYTDADRVC
ncbi:MAG: hypothetical protein ACKO14_06215 [Armatimonadota bacterium]